MIQEAITYHTFRDRDYGAVLVAKNKRRICAIILGDNEAELKKELLTFFPRAALSRERSSGADLNLEKLMKSPADKFELYGTDFQKRVWKKIKAIRPGKTKSYRDIAKSLGMPRAYRAVARACASNKLALYIPCHRVIGSNGSLSGYRWGIKRKQKLLAAEIGGSAPTWCF